MLTKAGFWPPVRSSIADVRSTAEGTSDVNAVERRDLLPSFLEHRACHSSRPKREKQERQLQCHDMPDIACDLFESFDLTTVFEALWNGIHCTLGQEDYVYILYHASINAIEDHMTLRVARSTPMAVISGHSQ